jgi:hypothetical protein
MTLELIVYEFQFAETAAKQNPASFGNWSDKADATDLPVWPACSQYTSTN